MNKARWTVVEVAIHGCLAQTYATNKDKAAMVRWKARKPISGCDDTWLVLPKVCFKVSDSKLSRYSPVVKQPIANSVLHQHIS